jgi:hypothetical protein
MSSFKVSSFSWKNSKNRAGCMYDKKIGINQKKAGSPKEPALGKYAQFEGAGHKRSVLKNVGLGRKR